MDENEKKAVISKYIENNKELIKSQRKYKNLLDVKILNCKEIVLQRSILNNLELHRKEKNELKTKLYVSSAAVHQREYQSHIDTLACHVLCQDKLTHDSDELKNNISTLEKQIRTVDRSIYDLNRKTVSDSQHSAHVAKANKTLEMLENQIEVSRLRESKRFAENTELRNTIIDMLHHRALFNKFWHKMIGKLSFDKKYLVDLVEHAILTFDNAIDVYQKIDKLNKNRSREMTIRKEEMQRVLHKITSNQNNHTFLKVKARSRALEDLEPREYKRREIQRTLHRNKISLYQKVLEKVLSFSGVASVGEAITKFQEQESLYYSYFNYANELTYKMTSLNNRINDLYKIIESLRHTNLSTMENQMGLILEHRRKLEEEKIKTAIRLKKRKNRETNLDQLFHSFYNIFSLANCDPAPLLCLLGNHRDVTVYNVQKFLKIIEERLNLVIACVFITQRDGKQTKKGKAVRDVVRIYEEPTAIDDIVLVQQCPECAEGEDVNPYDTEFVEPATEAIIKEKIREKVPQPEMQYRLHSLSQCRLPKSRILANKKF